MKKQLAWVLTVAALLGLLTACGGDQDVSGTIDPQEDGAAEEKEFQMGEMNGGTYTNAFLGISCQLSDDWTYYNEEQIAEINNMVADSISDEELSEMMEKASTVQDMYAASSDGLATINVVFENMGVVYGTVMDEEKYIQTASPNLEKALTDMGMTDVQMEETTREFAGATRHSLRVSGSMNEVPVFEELVCIKEGNYMATITMASYMEDITDDMAALFTAVEE